MRNAPLCTSEGKTLSRVTSKQAQGPLGGPLAILPVTEPGTAGVECWSIGRVEAADAPSIVLE
jgi:hypothetical protein